MAEILLKLNKMSIQNKLYVYFILVAAVPLALLCFFSYSKYSSILTRNTIQSTQQIIDQTTKNMDMMANGVEKITFMIFANKDIRSILQKGQGDTLKDRLYSRDAIQYTLYNYITSRDDIDSVYIIDEHKNLYYNTKDYNVTGKYVDAWISDSSKISAANGSVVWMGTHPDKFNAQEPKNVISAARLLKNFDTSQSLGILLANVEEKRFSDIYSEVNLGKSGVVFLMSSKGKIISHLDKKVIDNSVNKDILSNIRANKGNFVYTADGREVLVVYNVSSVTGFITVGQIPLDEILGEVYYVRNFIFYFGLLIIIAALFASIAFSKSITSPIKNLIKQMKRAEEGDFTARVEVEGSFEIQSMKMGFNRMIEKVRELINRVYEEQQKKKEAEMQALQAQINPHFLYNTLNSIKWMAVLHNMQNIVEMVTALNHLLYHSISKSGNIITIHEEIDNLKNYVVIQKYRYNDKFEVHYEYDEGVYEYKTLKLLLQPIVENSIFHGIENKKGTGNIYIRIFKSNDSVKYIIEDDGIGMSEEALEKVINYKKLVAGTRGFSSIGIRNIDERIKLYFGSDYGLTMQSVLGEGTIVEITTPIIK